VHKKRPTPASGPLAGYEPGYRAELVERGYKPRTVTTLIGLMRRLSCWMEAGGYAVGDLSSAVAEEFLAEVRASGRAYLPTLATLDSLFEYLRRVDAVPVALAPRPLTGIDVTVEGFRRYLEIERGLAPESVATYARATTTFLSWLHAHGHVDMARLTARDVVEFVTDVCPGHSTGWAKLLLTGIRSFLRFAHLTGLVPVSLVGAVPSAAGWSGTSLPRGLAPGDVKRLLSSCDRRRARGRRDHAILVLLVRLGLRAAEVADLSVDDVDWRAGEIVVHGKGDHDERLPLPADVGEAVAGYLRRGRPQSPHRALFLRVHAPVRGLRPGGVAEVVRDACRRADLDAVGPHRLRHTAATEMLRAGATLPEVAQVLRHHSAATTAIYAKVDHLALRELALPWPAEVA
jgi:site-specific recombinase XerD